MSGTGQRRRRAARRRRPVGDRQLVDRLLAGATASTRWTRSQSQTAWRVPSEPWSSIWWSWPNGDGSWATADTWSEAGRAGSELEQDHRRVLGGIVGRAVWPRPRSSARPKTAVTAAISPNTSGPDAQCDPRSRPIPAPASPRSNRHGTHRHVRSPRERRFKGGPAEVAVIDELVSQRETGSATRRAQPPAPRPRPRPSVVAPPRTSSPAASRRGRGGRGRSRPSRSRSGAGSGRGRRGASSGSAASSESSVS